MIPLILGEMEVTETKPFQLLTPVFLRLSKVSFRPLFIAALMEMKHKMTVAMKARHSHENPEVFRRTLKFHFALFLLLF